MGATHVIEHFVELLGVHDKVGVAYHVVDCICLDRRDTEDTECPAGLAGLRLWAKRKWPFPHPRGFCLSSWKDPSLA